MANTITTSRVFIAIIALIIMPMSAMSNLVAICLITVSMLLDAADGFIARWLNTCSLSGAVYDIFADRIIESIFFIYFSSMKLFSVWLAIIIIMRGLTIDTIRAASLAQGETAFGNNSLHLTRWCQFITASKISRASYNTVKMITFICYAALLEPKSYLFKYINYSDINLIATTSLYLTVCVALLRAVPVILDGVIFKTKT